MKKQRPIKLKVYVRAVVAIMLITVWSLMALTGLLLWLAPSGQGAGKQELLLGLLKSEWGDIHFWLGVATIVITVAHLIIDWRALKGVIRYLTSVHRGAGVTQQ
ncbi:DUF4405 domain-containing protein [Chloroflexota bacterium]